MIGEEGRPFDASSETVGSRLADRSDRTVGHAALDLVDLVAPEAETAKLMADAIERMRAAGVMPRDALHAAGLTGHAADAPVFSDWRATMSLLVQAMAPRDSVLP